ncbi:MAG: N-acetylmuramoyl-L-alanine amidase, partial [Stackebrandtia sp.]
MSREFRISRRGVLTGLTGLAVVSSVPFAAASAFAAGREVPQPDLYSCEDWGARPPNGTPGVVNAKPNKIICHHTAFPNSDDLSKEYAFQNSRDIQDLHMDDNGWMDSGQHFTNS